MKLYGYWRSSSTWRVRIALAYKGIACDHQPVHLLRNGGEQNTDGYREKNPLRTVPLLELSEHGTPQRVAQSMAILEFLEERYPQPPLLPRAPLDRARVRMLAETVNSGIQPLQNTAVLQWLKNELRVDEQAWSRHWMERGLTALEALADEGDFCVGGAVSFADVYLVPQLYNARRFGLDLHPFPKLLRIEASCQKLAAFVDSHPDRQPDAEKA